MPFRRVVLLAAILMVAMASIVSAARMAPERTSSELTAHLMMGGSHQDLCAEGSSHEKHHCPFCRLLSDPPKIRFSPCVRRATPTLVWQDLGHLIAGSLSGNPYISARAPPAPV